MLYGLKQAPRVWYTRIDEYLNGEGFNRCFSDLKLYTKVNREVKLLIVCLNADDLIFTRNVKVDEFKKI